VDDEARLDAELTLLVDGQLGRQRAYELETRPELAGRIALARAGREQLKAAAASVEAPFELRRRVDSLGTMPRRRRPRWRPLAALAGLAAAVVLALVLATSGGSPTVDGVLADTGRAPAAAVSPSGGPLLPVEIEGVRFPDYEEKFGWRAVGQREDEIDGRKVRTVFYARGRGRVTYSIVAGDALAEPSGRDVAAEGTRLRVIGNGAVTWRRRGHTCVMEGPALRTVAELAGWTAKGKVVF
jgi:anti-sigma factor RsiW